MNDLLGNDLGAHILFEVFKRNALSGGSLFQVVHTFELHLLAHFVKPLDQFSVGGNTEVLAFFQQKLAVYKPAENVLLAGGDHLGCVRRILLLRFIFKLLLLAFIIGASDDLIVDAGNDFFYHCVGGE